MPIFRWVDKVLGIARGARAVLSREGGTAPGAVPNAERREERARNRKEIRRRASEQRKKLVSERRDAKRELSRIKTELNAAKGMAEEGKADRSEQMRRARKKKQELLRLKSELRTAKKQTEDEEPETGALPDFVVIGAGRSGTSFFYRLLNQHPHVQPAAKKELHFFDLLFDEGAEWYRLWFPEPMLVDGRTTITGEATPTYISLPLVPERMAEVVPQARLIAMLRNPVDRIYSAYHHRVRTGRESRTFEEVIETDLADGSLKLLSKSTYVDHLVRWPEFFGDEQMLVLKSEDLFERPQETLETVLAFLDLPDWQPEIWESGKKGRYDRMDPATRRRLEEYFEPHNRRLYDYLGRDLGW